MEENEKTDIDQEFEPTESSEELPKVVEEIVFDAEITFDKIDRIFWIEYISELRNIFIHQKEDTGYIKINMSKSITPETVEPAHIVLFSCLIEHLVSLNYYLYTDIEDEDFQLFLYSDLKFSSYFANDGTLHCDSPREDILNLWKIAKGSEKGYSISVSEYFRRNYFNECDLTVFQSSLDEVYLNVADHSKAEGNAFSYIQYDEKGRSIKVAVCDFGLGIPTTLKNSGKYIYIDDCNALRDSLEIGVSARTNPHNKGFGLDNVVSNLMNNDMLRIVSNNGLLVCCAGKNPLKTFDLDFDFKGTLIYFDVCIDAFQADDDLMSDISIG